MVEGNVEDQYPDPPNSTGPLRIRIRNTSLPCCRSNKPLVTLNDQLETSTIRDLKKVIASKKSKVRFTF